MPSPRPACLRTAQGLPQICSTARDEETGRVGTYQTTFVIPNLNKETRRVPISSVVLSSQRVDVKDALYNATKVRSRSRRIQLIRWSRDGRKPPGESVKPESYSMGRRASASLA